jgi:hypothetical protein
VTQDEANAIHLKWWAVKDKPVEISFPKSADPAVVKCIVDMVRGEIYDLLTHIQDQAREIRQLKMEALGLTEEDMAWANEQAKFSQEGR